MGGFARLEDDDIARHTLERLRGVRARVSLQGGVGLRAPESFFFNL
jgi:hypothetical protein